MRQEDAGSAPDLWARLADLEAQLQRCAQEKEALSERERELSDFLENAAEGLHQIGPDGRILWANRAQWQMLGYEPDQYIGHHIREFHDDPQVADDILQRLLRGEPLHDYAATLRCRDGQLKHVLIHSNACFRNGEFQYSRCFTRDMTERLQAEQANARLAAIVDDSDDAIIGTSLDGVIQTWNYGAQRIYGYRAEEVIGRPILLLLPPDRRDEEQVILSRIAAGQRVEHYETRRLTRAGRVIDVSLTVSPIRDGSGRIIGVSKIARDISERKRMEDSLRQMNTVLEQRVAERTAALQEQSARLRELALELGRAEQRERRRIAAQLHDTLAQTLAVGNLNVSMLEAQQPQVAQTRAFAALKNTFNDAIGCTRSLMYDLSPPLLHDQGLTAAVQDLAQRMKQRHGLDVTVHSSRRLPIPQDVRTVLFEAVRELLINVVKYSRAGSATVSIDKSPTLVTVLVEDQGAGFDVHRLPQRPSEQGGFGLLNIRERVHLLGGEFHIESQLGQGTRCRLQVPIAGTDAS